MTVRIRIRPRASRTGGTCPRQVFYRNGFRVVSIACKTRSTRRRPHSWPESSKPYKAANATRVVPMLSVRSSERAGMMTKPYAEPSRPHVSMEEVTR
jgi:hypothetical protein